MKEKLIRQAVRSRFKLTSRSQALKQAADWCSKYLQIANQLDVQAGSLPVRVPPMLGVDEDMRNWSFFMLLEHNTIVNHSISAIIQSLAHGREVDTGDVKDPKTDVMPSVSPGIEQLDLFRQSIEEHIAAVETLPELRGTEEYPHPIFGMFDAHKWNCMFSFHLQVHIKQAQYIAQKARSGSA